MDLAITSLGMISSIGRDVAISCASIRAGIIRHAEINYVQLLDDELEAIPLLGHPIRAYCEGFYATGLWLRIATGCIKNLLQYGNLPDESDLNFWERTGLIGVTPVIDDRFENMEPPDSNVIKEIYLYKLADFLSCPILKNNLDVVSMGHTGTISAIIQAEKMLALTHLDRIIILAVDSYLDPMTLNWLSDYRRLKTAENPIGLTPGEAGACFMVEPIETARTRGAKIEAVIKGAKTGFEKNHYFSDNTNQGIGLAYNISKILSIVSTKIPFEGDIISDLNGENWKAYELASAKVRMGNKISTNARIIIPCESTGETGAASGAVAVCVAVRSLIRNYSTNDEVIITSSSEYGHVGAACISRYAG